MTRVSGGWRRCGRDSRFPRHYVTQRSQPVIYVPEQLIERMFFRRDDTRPKSPLGERLEELVEATRYFLRGRAFGRVSLDHVLHERRQKVKAFVLLREESNGERKFALTRGRDIPRTARRVYRTIFPM